MHYDVYMSRAMLLLPFTCNFHYSYYSLRIVVHFFIAIIHIPHCTAQLWIQKEQVCLLAAVYLMHNHFVWLYSTLFQRHRNVMETNECIYNICVIIYNIIYINRTWNLQNIQSPYIHLSFKENLKCLFFFNV